MRSRERCLTLAISLLLIAITWLVFAQTLGFEFVNYDDPVYVPKNPHVNRGLTSGGIVWAFTHVYSANWHPLTWISHMLDCQVYGLNPHGHHLTNVLLHTLNVVLLFLFFSRTTDAPWRSAFVAAVFAIHPLRAESVAWIAERKDVLSGFFFILTLTAYARYARRGGAVAYAGALVLFVLGLLCKPMVVTLPVILLLLDLWPLERLNQSSWRRLLLEKLPFLLLGAAMSGVTILAQKHAILDLERIPISLRLANAATSCITYLRQLFWPSSLAAFYPFTPSGVSPSTVIFAVALLLALSIAAAMSHRHRYVLSGWFWYLVMLLPVIGIVQVGEQARADRYTYLPHIGFCFALTWLVGDLSSRSATLKYFFAASALVVLVSLGTAARTQVSYWRDSASLWQRAVAVTPDNPTLRRHLGTTFHERGDYERAIAEYELSLQLDPRQPRVIGRLGAVLLERGQIDEGFRFLQQAVAGDPEDANAQANLGQALLDRGRTDEAIARFEEALKLDPDFTVAHYDLANAFLTSGRDREAIAEYERAIELDPHDERALNNIAWILATSPDDAVRNGTKAVDCAARAKSLAPNDPRISATLAAAYAEVGRFGDATSEAQRGAEFAVAAGNTALADSIRAQRAFYRAGAPFRDQR